MVRIIHYVGPDGREGITFTEYVDTDSSDYVPHGCTLKSDEEYDIELPSDFPIEHQLEKIF